MEHKTSSKGVRLSCPAWRRILRELHSRQPANCILPDRAAPPENPGGLRCGEEPPHAAGEVNRTGRLSLPRALLTSKWRDTVEPCRAQEKIQHEARALESPSLAPERKSGEPAEESGPGRHET
ncbi:hypothetical protein NDU88_003028 [Pleurodeles waltl]|uniref:Uncharacterized protein n=1 Tax=Pleurodeles waltl TaxID=8319 RepID=A0AAV7VC96_PLEWA|nr:hypothetical protein NDU88_003028 [Pleurodeles waltl]